MRVKQRTVTLNEISLGTNLSKVRNQLEGMTKSSYAFKDKITVIALQQGIGKTHMFTEYAKNHWKKEKIILASPRHNHLEEVSNKLGAKKSRHWYGFSHKNKYNIYKGCKKLNENIPILNNLKKQGNENLLSPKFVCNLLGCPKNKCRYYITRGKSKNIDLMPLEYLGVDSVLKQKPNIVFIDESIDKIDEYRYDATLISDCIKIAKNNGYKQLTSNLKTISPKPKIGTVKQNLLDSIEDDTNNLVTVLISNKNHKDATRVSSISTVLRYLRYATLYASDKYYRPKIYDAFDLAYNYEIKVVFLNASFNDNLFTYFLETYPNKIGNVTLPKYTSNVTNARSTILRVYPDNKFWKAGFATYNIQNTTRDIFKVIRIIENYIPKEKIGIITYDTSGFLYGNIPIEYQFSKYGYDTVHFWDEAGLNVLENKYVLFIIGTPFIPTDNLILNWEEIHDTEFDRKKKEFESKDKDGYYFTDWVSVLEYETYEVGDFLSTLPAIDKILKRWGYYKPGYQWHHDALLKIFNDEHTKEYDFTLVKRQYIDQMTDAIHRCRALTHDRLVIALGDVLGEYPWIAMQKGESPYKLVKSINKLIGIKQINVNTLKELDKEVKNHRVVINNKVRTLFEYIIDNKEYLNKSTIAKVLKLKDKHRNPDTKFIGKLEDIADKIKAKIK